MAAKRTMAWKLAARFLVAGRDSTVLFEAAEKAFDLVALANQVLAKQSSTMLAAQARDRDANASPTEIGFPFAARVSLVCHYTPRPEARSTSSGPLDRSRFQQSPETDRVMSVAWSDDHHHALSLALRSDVDLRG